jgi:hypothetical protein
MISNDAIHVQAKEGGKYGNVEGISTPKVNNCLYAVHEAW